MSSEQEEEIRIYFSKDFDKNEVAEITEAFNKIAPTHGIANAGISLDSVDAKTVIETAFLLFLILKEIGVTEIGKGFFNSIGSDLKDKLVQVLRKKKKAHVSFKLHYKNTTIDINAKLSEGNNVEEWKRIFETIDTAEKKAIAEIENDNRIRGMFITYDINVDGYWKLEKW